jgi:glycosyltransferase involved in cell wall biosynthesis
MFCSTVIPTISRPTLSRSVNSVLNQRLTADNFEVIVVNDSGQPLPKADWQRSERVQIINTNRHNRSVARNTGAAIAKGRYLHFLDDDDWIFPDALQHFWELANTSQGGWLYGAFRLVDNAGGTITEVFPDEVGNCFIQLLSWEWLPIQASLVESKAFFSVGGFATVQPFSTVFQDLDLSRQIARYYHVAGTDRIVASIRAGDVSSTTSYSDMFTANRQSREKILNTSGTFSRLRASARVSPTRSGYWYGRIVYYYLASLKWNALRKHLLTAASRGVYTLASLAIAGRHLLSTDFWLGALKPHLPRARIAVEESGANLYANTRWRM